MRWDMQGKHLQLYGQHRDVWIRRVEGLGDGVRTDGQDKILYTESIIFGLVSSPSSNVELKQLNVLAEHGSLIEEKVMFLNSSFNYFQIRRIRFVTIIIQSRYVHVVWFLVYS